MAIHPVVKTLLDEIEDYRAKTGLSATAFGTEALNDPCFIRDLAGGNRVPSLKTIDRVRSFMQWHEGVSA